MNDTTTNDAKLLIQKTRRTITQRMYTNRSFRDCQYEVHTRPGNWEHHDDIDYRTNVFLEVVARLCNENNVHCRLTAFLDISEFYKALNLHMTNAHSRGFASIRCLIYLYWGRANTIAHD